MIDVTEETYPGILNTLVTFTRTILAATEQVDLAEMRSICERFQALAPVLEPTAYQQGGDLNLADQAAFLRALEEFVTAVRKLDRRPAGPIPAPGRVVVDGRTYPIGDPHA